ncbi:radical SAM protein [Defluviicoccus vanus]|uniref:Radical SAM protein n=1 Tax=Defluviicoccus vanus TaxID=111831 RepID=A0A7H1N3M6_9PROT|nr:radical SAM protein [Defluviicoccus vanus]QNT70312.1 radical SAM protein [Defluviicoccus vanus]
MPDTTLQAPEPGAPGKFHDPDWTAKGEVRAVVAPTALSTLWFNTGSLCNIACLDCYIESSPHNDRLAYLTLAEVRQYLDEGARERFPVVEIGFTGGEPFMNRALPTMLAEVLGRDLRALVLTNAMKPMQQRQTELLALVQRFGTALTMRVSIDSPTPVLHEALRGKGTWETMLAGLRWLVAHDFRVHVAGRTRWAEDAAVERAAYARLFAAEGIAIDADDPVALMLFPEMDLARDVPEITTRCWNILGVSPDAMMCASSRMVVKRKGAAAPTVVSCTLLPYDPAFEMGTTLAEAQRPVKLNHPFCAQFCVLGGASCAAR